MSNELPHATLRCAECSTAFRVTLKKGRPPSRPIPCPRCKTPVTVTEADIVAPGKKKAARKEGADELRQTKPRDILRETRHVKIDPKVIESAVDPPTSEIDPDPPTSEVDVESDPDGAEKDDFTPTPQSTLVPDSPVNEELGEERNEVDDAAGSKFGIIRKKRIATRPPESGIGLTVASPGVHVVKGEGSAARDDVFAPPRSRISSSPGSVAIGRIRPRQVTASRLKIDAEDPDLPTAALPQGTANNPGSGMEPEDSNEKPKLNLDKLRRAMNRLGTELPESSDSDDEFSFDGLMSDLDQIEESEVEDLAFDDIDDVEEIEISLPGDEVAVVSEVSEVSKEVEAADPDEEPDLDDFDGSEPSDISAEPPRQNAVPIWVAMVIFGGFLLLSFVVAYSILA